MPLENKAIRKKYRDINEFLKKEAGKHRCACGCKEVIDLKKSHFWNGIPKYLFGHAARLRIGGPSYDKNKFFSVKDIAEASDSSEQTIRLWMRSGKISPEKVIGRKNLFLKSKIMDFLSTHHKRVPFIPENYVTVKELKKMGVSRSKLRAKVREKLISNPRIYARKTQYLRDEIEKYMEQIMEDRKAVKQRGKMAASVYKELITKFEAMEKRIAALEIGKINKAPAPKKLPKLAPKKLTKKPQAKPAKKRAKK